MLFNALLWNLELSALPDLSVSQRCKFKLIVLNALLVSPIHQLKLSALLVLSVKPRNSAQLGNQCALKDLPERATSLIHPNLFVLLALISSPTVLRSL